MHHARNEHSMNQFAGFIYVFCGINDDVNFINSVEKLAIHADPDQQIKESWQLIPSQNLVKLPNLYEHFSVALNSDEILLLGGSYYKFKKAQIYDTRTDESSQVDLYGMGALMHLFMNRTDSFTCEDSGVS